MPGNIPARGSARSWYATAGTAAVAAIVMLALRTDLAITAAGLLASAAAGTSLAGARLRARWPDTADARSVIVGASIFATTLSVLLGVVMACQPER